METVGWNAVLPQAPICCLGPRQLKETSHSPVLTGPHATAQGKMEMPAPCLKSVGFQDRESRELNEARRPAHLHRPPATTPPRLGDPAPCLLGPGQPSESPSASTAREALTACLCVAGGCQTSRAQILYVHTARCPTPASGISQARAAPRKPVHFPVISDYPSSLPRALLMAQAPLHSRLLPLSLAAGSRTRSVDTTDVSIWLCFQDLWA